MIRVYQGHFKDDGRFIADNKIVKIPTNRRVIINVLDEIIDAEVTKSNEEEITKRQEMVKSLKGCLAGYDVDLAQIREERIAKRGLLE